MSFPSFRVYVSMDTTAVLILITTNDEMKKYNTGIAVKEVQLDGDFGGRIGRLLIVFPRERCIHKDCTEGVVVNKGDKTVIVRNVLIFFLYAFNTNRFAIVGLASKLYFSYSIVVLQLTH